MSKRSWRLERNVLSFDEGEHFSFVKELVVHQILKEHFAEASIDIIDNVTTVHDLTKEITEIVPWNLTRSLVVVHVILEYN